MSDDGTVNGKTKLQQSCSDDSYKIKSTRLQIAMGMYAFWKKINLVTFIDKNNNNKNKVKSSPFMYLILIYFGI